MRIDTVVEIEVPFHQTVRLTNISLVYANITLAPHRHALLLLQKVIDTPLPTTC